MSSKMFGLLLVALFAIAALVIAPRIDQRAEEIKAETSAVEVEAEEEREIVPPFPQPEGHEPETLDFYTFNSRYKSARISVKNNRGQAVWGQLSENPLKIRLWLGGGFSEKEQRVKISIPKGFELAKGYTVTVHFADGPVTRFQQVSKTWDPYTGHAWVYMLVSTLCNDTLIPKISAMDQGAVPENWQQLTGCPAA